MALLKADLKGKLPRLISTLLIGFALGLGPIAASANPYNVRTEADLAREKARALLCPSTDEFVKALKFLRDSKDPAFPEDAAREIAIKVAGGCDGAAERFSQILALFKTIGVSEKRAMEMALEFAASPPDAQKNFLEIFNKAFLKEFFDYEFGKALKIALELARDYKGDPAQAREDFVELARFCKGRDTLGLSMPFCSEYALRVARLSQYYPNGVGKPFLDLYKKLRDSRRFGLNVKTALETSFFVLRSGPRAPENFVKAFDIAVNDFKFDRKMSLEFALRLADRSFVGEAPPLMSFPSEGKAVP